MSFELPYITALVLGTLHAFEADHLAAVTSFAVQKPQPRAAMRFGAQWALGHGTAILVVGAVLIFLGLRIPAAASETMDRVVGAVLISLGAWTLWVTRRLHAHEHVHDGQKHVHLHSHLVSKGHDHKHAPTVMGLMHGLAGAAPAVALIPLARFDTAFGGVAYLLIFAAGTAASMSMYALFAGYMAGRATRFAEGFGRAVGQFAGLGTVVIGFVWLIR
ncbi:MAG TPA: sulfite exporter TauE/SafE family protein [Longimicrobiales bacterium]|nr:sulfite exporter TauE/SafE family protein [Longimicrobiales bacterium]